MSPGHHAPRVLIAGIGNIFLGDDGFGVEVVSQLRDALLPDWVQVADYGISGMHLAYDLVGGYDTTILVDATPRGGEPGTVYLVEPERSGEPSASAAIDAHGMQPDVVLQLLELLGGGAGRVLIVGCEPESTEYGIGLSPSVTDAVAKAARLVIDLSWGVWTPESSARQETPRQETVQQKAAQQKAAQQKAAQQKTAQQKTEV